MADFLLKNGPISTVHYMRENVYEFRCLDSYSHHSDGLDRGEASKEGETKSANRPRRSWI